MAQISQQSSQGCSLPAVEAAADFSRRAHHAGWSIAHVAPTQVDVRRGSQAALRLKGGWATGLKSFPVVAAVRFDPSGSGSVAIINTQDDLGVGLMLGMKGKYEKAVADFATEIASMIASMPPSTTVASGETVSPGHAPHNTMTCPNGHQVSTGARFCSLCGAALSA